jgi:hypothetical protein
MNRQTLPEILRSLVIIAAACLLLYALLALVVGVQP